MEEITNELIVKIEKTYRDKYECHNCRLTFMESQKLKNVLKDLKIDIKSKEYWELYYRVTWESTKWKAAMGIKNCEICGYEFKDICEKSGDHIKPVSKGGFEFDLNNIQTVCMKCNLKKGAKILPKGKLHFNRTLDEFTEENNDKKNNMG